MEEKQEFMKKQPVLPLLLRMSLPVMLSMLIQSLYNIVDSIWVSRLGTDALTAVSLAFPLQNIVLSVGVGMGVGIGSVISLNLGAGNRQAANQAASTGVFLVLIHCLFFIVGGLLITKPFLQMFTSDADILKNSCDYTYLVLCVSFAQLLQMCFEKIFQGIGRMKTTMFLMASGCLINIVLDPILIFGWLGFPAMGVKGAALATVIGQIGAMILYVVVYFWGKIEVEIHPKHIVLKKELIFRIYSIGIPASLTLSMPSVLTGVLNGILAGFDQAYVAVFGLYFKLQTLINMPSNGLVQGMRPIISYNYGAGENKRVKETILWSFAIVAAIMTVGTAAAIGFPEMILRAFDADEKLLVYGIPALRIIGTSFLVSTVGIVCGGVFEALGKGKEALALSLLRQFVITIPLGWLLSRVMGAEGIWIAFPVAEIAAALAGYRMLKKTGVLDEKIRA